MTITDKINKLSKWLCKNRLEKDAISLNNLIKISNLGSFNPEHMRIVFNTIQGAGAPDHSRLADSFYKIIRYSDFSENEWKLTRAIQSSEEYKEWSEKVDPGGLGDFDLENKKYWEKLQNIPGVSDIDINPSEHIEVTFDYPSDERGRHPARRQLNGIKLNQDLYFSFELTDEAKQDSSVALEAIQNYLRWILEVARYSGETNKVLKEGGSSTSIRALKFNPGINLNYLAGSLFDEKDTLKIYFANAHPKFLKQFYDNVISLKNSFSGFTTNENRARLARGFDLSRVPNIGGMSFGQIVAYRMAFHALNSLEYAKSIEDDEEGKKQFVEFLGNIMDVSQRELIIHMDNYITNKDSSGIEKVLQESKII